MSVRRSLFLLLILIVAAPFVVFLRAQGRSNSAAASRLENIQLYRVTAGDVELSVSAIGTLDADRQTDVSFLTTGRVQDVYVQRDEYVLAGDPLVKLDSAAAELAYEQALLTRDQAEMAMQNVLIVDADQIALAEAAVTSAQGAYYSIGNAVSDEDITAAQLAYDQALKTNDESVLARDTAPPGRYDILAAEAGEASFNLEIARLQLEQLQTGSGTAAQSRAAYARVLQAQQELERVKAGASDVQIEAAQAQIDRAESQVRQAETSLGRTMLVAPHDGVIATLNAEKGTLVAPSIPVVTLVDVNPLTLTVQVDEVDIRLIEQGYPVRVELDALPGVLLEAQVVRVADVGTTTGGIVTYDVDIELSGEDPRARVGMTADATIVIAARTDALFVPNLYIRVDRFTDESFVNILRQDDSIEEVAVTLGLQGQDVSEIVSGLAEGDLVALDLGGRGLNEFLGN